MQHNITNNSHNYWRLSPQKILLSIHNLALIITIKKTHFDWKKRIVLLQLCSLEAKKEKIIDFEIQFSLLN